MIRSFLGFGVAGEGKRCRLQVDFSGFRRNVGCGDGQEDAILLRVSLGRTLGPEDCE